jgi:small subunit ribosomal protein S20
MAQHQSAIKRIRTSEKSRVVNRQKRSKMTTMIKSVRMAKNKKDAEVALTAALPYLDKMASKNIIHKNKAANQKSRLTKFVNQMK